eukprot:CAMPEP_0175708390 /NCGR_PEP_ID=MMETSP0097-20121207/39044_1 /TAXON_ID=311494 /ORGANISM="Alexandrium monilatum, Strain CCMP3105" /LENGTH=57 /DNA_ID=CAMNT_0017015781 /DNA_START=38 /DNA_END=207 /DNA_ORIENTATION=-
MAQQRPTACLNTACRSQGKGRGTAPRSGAAQPLPDASFFPHVRDHALRRACPALARP